MKICEQNQNLQKSVLCVPIKLQRELIVLKRIKEDIMQHRKSRKFHEYLIFEFSRMTVIRESYICEN